MTLFECFREDPSENPALSKKPRSESTQSRHVCDDTHSTSDSSNCDEQPDYEQFEDQFLNSSLSL